MLTASLSLLLFFQCWSSASFGSFQSSSFARTNVYYWSSPPHTTLLHWTWTKSRRAGWQGSFWQTKGKRTKRGREEEGSWPPRFFFLCGGEGGWGFNACSSPFLLFSPPSPLRATGKRVVVSARSDSTTPTLFLFSCPYPTIPLLFYYHIQLTTVQYYTSQCASRPRWRPLVEVVVVVGEVMQNECISTRVSLLLLWRADDDDGHASWWRSQGHCAAETPTEERKHELNQLTKPVSEMKWVSGEVLLEVATMGPREDRRSSVVDRGSWGWQNNWSIGCQCKKYSSVIKILYSVCLCCQD